MSVDKLLDEMLKKIQAMTPEEALEHHIKSRYLEDPILVDFNWGDVPRYPQKDESESYNMITDKNGNDWFYGDTGSEIYVDQHNPNSKGFCGRKLKFKLKDGTVVETENGPWHSNADALLNATGVNFTNEHLTFGCISLGIEYIEGQIYGRYKNVIYLDGNYTCGDYSRIRNLAQEFANKLNTKVYFTQHSGGGSVSHFEEPKNYKFEELKRGSFYHLKTDNSHDFKFMYCHKDDNIAYVMYYFLMEHGETRTCKFDFENLQYDKSLTINQYFPKESVVKYCRRFLNIIEK